jgi:hypothetical protein
MEKEKSLGRQYGPSIITIIRGPASGRLPRKVSVLFALLFRSSRSVLRGRLLCSVDRRMHVL